MLTVRNTVNDHSYHGVILAADNIMQPPELSYRQHPSNRLTSIGRVNDDHQVNVDMTAHAIHVDHELMNK